MKLSKAAKWEIEHTSWLNKCLNEYFAPDQFIFDRSHIVGIKWRPDGYYAVLLMKVGKNFYVVDIAGTYGNDYVVCNDGDEITEQEWKGLKVDPYCDGYTLAEDRK